jgi:predicted DNA-binding ribbon-helix-helix protein
MKTMKSSLIMRCVVIAGRKTSVSLEDGFWKALKEIAGGQDVTLSDLLTIINADRHHSNLSSAIRLFVLAVYRDRISNPQSSTRETLAA